jgi:hypothetical protein
MPAQKFHASDPPGKQASAHHVSKIYRVTRKLHQSLVRALAADAELLHAVSTAIIFWQRRLPLSNLGTADRSGSLSTFAIGGTYFRSTPINGHRKHA